MAEKSMRSLKRHMDIECVVASPRGISGFDRYIQLTPRRRGYWYLNSVRYFNEALESLEGNILCLDCDTFACGPMDEIFELLDKYDLVGAHAPARQTTKAKDVPEAFPEINIGVMAFKNNKEVRELFADWLKKYEADPKFYGDNDQGPLREALWEWDGRLYIIPPEYNCRWMFGGYAAGPVRMLHGVGKHEAVCSKLNERGHMRGWKKGDI